MTVRSGRFNVIALLVVLYVLAGANVAGALAGAPESGTGDGLTVTRRVIVDKPQVDARRIPLLSLYADPDGGTPLVSAAWAMESTGWFPVWNVKVSAVRGPGDPGTPGEQTVLMRPISPVAGHEYEVALSYSYEKRVVAFSLGDLTEGRILELGEWPLDIVESDGRLYGPPGGEGAHASIPRYVPVGIRWDVVDRSHGSFIPLTQVAEGDDAGLRITSGGESAGALQVVVRGDGQQVVLPLETGSGDGFIPLDVSRLPAGPVTVALQYILDETVVWESVAKRMVVGRLTARVERADFNQEENSVDLDVALSADRPLDAFALRLVAERFLRTWDEQKQSFAETPHGAYEAELAGSPSAEGRALVRIPLPNEPGLWRLDMRIDATPGVSASLDTKELIVSTALGALLGARTGDGRAVRVCTYNMLNFEGWPQDEAAKDLGGPADPRRIDHFTQVIRGLGCDILGIQEGYSVDTLRTIGHRLGLNVAPFASSTRFPGGTLTRFPILESRMFNHTGLANQNMPFSRFGGASLLDIEGELVWLVNFHAWPHDEQMRMREAEVLGRQLEQLALVTPHMIVLGDFNSGPGAAIDQTLRERGLANAMYLDWIAGNKPSIDHIYVSGNLVGRVVAGWVESGPGFVNDGSAGRNWANSDHRPTIVELVWPRGD